MTVNLLVIVNEKISSVQDSMELEISQAKFWLNDIINQTEQQSKIKKEKCEICYSSSEKLENHHIAGRKHDFRQMTVCYTCHRWLTERQYLWDSRWKEKTTSENLAFSFFLMGLYDILILKTKKTGNSVYESLASSLIQSISFLQGI